MLNATRGMVTTGTNATTIVRSVDPRVFFLQAKVAPLITILKRLKKGKNPTQSYKFEWVEEDTGTPLTINQGALNAAATTINVEAGAGAMFTVNDLVWVPTTGEIIKVLSVTADALDVTGGRGYGTTAAAAIADQASLVLLAPAFAQGTTSPSGISINPTMPFNYTQIFKHTVEASRTEVQTDRYDYKNPAMIKRRARAMQLHMEAIERAYLFGQKKLDATGPRSLTAGFMSFVTTNVLDCQSAFTKQKMDDFLGDTNLYNEGDKWLFASSGLLSALHKEVLATSTLNIDPRTKDWGLDIRKYISPYGSINIVYHRLLSQVLDGYGLLIDMDNIEDKPLQATREKLNVGANDFDGMKDEILTESGIQVMLEKNHGIIYNP